MSYKDGDWSIFPTRTGIATGSANERQMLDAIGGAESFRTRLMNNADGSTTLLRTKGGMPQFETMPAATSIEIVKKLGVCFFAMPFDNANLYGYSPMGDGRFWHLCKDVYAADFTYPATHGSSGKYKLSPFSADSFGNMTWFSDAVKSSEGYVIVSWSGCSGRRHLVGDIRHIRTPQGWPKERTALAQNVWVNGDRLAIADIPAEHGIISAAIAKGDSQDSSRWLLRVVACPKYPVIDNPVVVTVKITAPIAADGKYKTPSILETVSVQTVVLPLIGQENYAPTSPPFFSGSGSRFLWCAVAYGGYARLLEVDAETLAVSVVQVKTQTTSSSSSISATLRAVDYIGDDIAYCVEHRSFTGDSRSGSWSYPNHLIQQEDQPLVFLGNGVVLHPYVGTATHHDGVVTNAASSTTTIAVLLAKIDRASGAHTFQEIHAEYDQSTYSRQRSTIVSASITAAWSYTTDQTGVIAESGYPIVSNYRYDKTGLSTDNNTSAIVQGVLACDLRARAIVVMTQNTTFSNIFTESGFDQGSSYKASYSAAATGSSSSSFSSHMTNSRVESSSIKVVVDGVVVNTFSDITLSTQSGFDGTVEVYPDYFADYNESSGAIPISVRNVDVLGAVFGSSISTHNEITTDPIAVCAFSPDINERFVHVLWPAKQFNEAWFVGDQTFGHSTNNVPVRYSPGNSSCLSGPLFLPLLDKFK